MTDSDKLFLEAEMRLDECIELRKNGSTSEQGKADMLMAEAIEDLSAMSFPEAHGLVLNNFSHAGRTRGESHERAAGMAATPAEGTAPKPVSANAGNLKQRDPSSGEKTNCDSRKEGPHGATDRKAEAARYGSPSRGVCISVNDQAHL